MKAAAVCLVTTLFIPLGNSLSAALTPGQQTPAFLDYLAWWHIFTHEDVNGCSWVNVLVFYLMLAASVVLLAVGLAREVRRRKN